MFPVGPSQHARTHLHHQPSWGGSSHTHTSAWVSAAQAEFQHIWDNVLREVCAQLGQAWVRVPMSGGVPGTW